MVPKSPSHRREPWDCTMICINEKKKNKPYIRVYVCSIFSNWCFHDRCSYTHKHRNVYKLQNYNCFHLLLKASNLSWSETQWQKWSSWNNQKLLWKSVCQKLIWCSNGVSLLREFFTRENLVTLLFPTSCGKSSKKYWIILSSGYEIIFCVLKYNQQQNNSQVLNILKFI